ncbi:metal-dependent phosphohydrolase [Micromonospora sp. NPDC050417]|uniref:metal-dependent phosphohydrolase n=1 Tax=Micromonospora sp. NPDC050417 TaxID=3364280 RepID=UPI0037AF9B64
MTVPSPPRHPTIDRAMADARTWCAGRIIDDRPAIAHAVRVAVTLGRHVPDVAPDMVAAALLHDSPEFAPAGINLDAVLTSRYGPEVTRVIRALEVEHAALDSPDPPVTVDDHPVLLISTADKIVALTSLLRRAVLSGNIDAFFGARPGLLRLLPYFRRCHRASAEHVPPTMTNQLGIVLDHLDQATAPARLALR